MRNIAIWCVVLLAMAGTAFSETRGLPKELAVDLGNRVKLEMILIPAGSFMMGSAEYNDEKPVHKVTITKPFYLGKYEVTQEQWEAVVGASSNPSGWKGPKLPVQQISWEDCQAFLSKLNAKTGGQGGKFALPTEAQWEYACRAGSTSKYCFGDDKAELGDYAWYEANWGQQLTGMDAIFSRAHPVGGKKSNAFGLYDMHGNLWEWCADWYDAGYYAKSPADDPKGPTTGSGRAARGGSWGSRGAEFCRSAVRDDLVPASRNYYLGFRVSRVPADK